jgi:hypothetical protein
MGPSWEILARKWITYRGRLDNPTWSGLGGEAMKDPYIFFSKPMIFLWLEFHSTAATSRVQMILLGDADARCNM